jgi:hypothetical protein
MQIVNCTVAIDGEAGMTVAKAGVTVAELLVLRAIHGDDAVRNAEVVGDVDVSPAEERERLSLLSIAPPGIVRDTLGAQGSLPESLDETNFPEDFIIGNAPAPKRGKKKASATEDLKVTDTE